MPVPRFRPVPLLLAVLVAGTPALAMADPPRERSARPAPEAREASRPRRDDALADSVRRIERSTRGQVLRAERMQSDGRDVNRIKVVDERGRVRVYLDDPRQPEPRRRTRDNDD